EPFTVQAFAEAERVVAADGDQAIDAQEFQVAQHVRSEVEDALLIGRHRILRIAQEVGHILGLDLGRVGAAGVQKRATGAVDRAYLVLVELAEAVVKGRWFGRVEMKKTAPTTANTHHFVAFVDRTVY